MAGIIENANRIKANLEAAYSAIEAKGGTAPTNSDGLAAAIEAIPSGGATEEISADDLLSSIAINEGEDCIYIACDGRMPDPGRFISLKCKVIGGKYKVERGIVSDSAFVAETESVVGSQTSFAEVPDQTSGWIVYKITPDSGSLSWLSLFSSEPTGDDGIIRNRIMNNCVKAIRFGYCNLSDLTSVANMFAIESLDMSLAALTGAVSMNRFAQSATSLRRLVLPESLIAAGLTYSFSSATSLTGLRIPSIAQCGGFISAFQSMYSLETIDLGTDAPPTSASTNSIFASCQNLKNAPNGLPFPASFVISASTRWTHDALVNILASLPTVETTQTLTMGATNLAKLTDDEKAVATEKGWTLA